MEKKKLGRPKRLKNTHNVHVLLTSDLVEVAYDAGNGNISVGIRLALKIFAGMRGKK